MMWLSNDQLAFAVSKLHPKLVCWQDYWTAHPVAPGSDEQIGEAEIIAWQPKHIPQPDRATLWQTFQQHADEFYVLTRQNKAQYARAERNARLAESDWTQLRDCPETIRKAWQRYRQALREMPQQAGFPNQIIWPESPTDSLAACQARKEGEGLTV